MRFLPLLLPLFLLLSCGPKDRQDLDLSSEVVDAPLDGIGHYVYALNLSERVAAGTQMDVQMEWRTVGPGDPKSRYTMEVVLDGTTRKVYTVSANANTVGELHISNWHSYFFDIPADFPLGEYTLGVRIRDEEKDGLIVPLGYVAAREMGEGFYRLAEVEIVGKS